MNPIFREAERRPAHFQYEKVDTNRLKTLTSSKPVDADSISFGPPKAGGPAGWGRNSQSKGASNW